MDQTINLPFFSEMSLRFCSHFTNEIKGKNGNGKHDMSFHDYQCRINLAISYEDGVDNV